jgi:hypothetical protein
MSPAASGPRPTRESNHGWRLGSIPGNNELVGCTVRWPSTRPALPLGMMRWQERYMAGEHVQVWAEMTDLGERIRDEAARFDDAQAVVAETMRRARANVERLVAELTRRHYRFEDTSRPAHEPPVADIAVRLDDLQEAIGVMPLALRGWLEQVGRVDLVGSFQGWSYRYTDPLVVEAPIDYVLAEHAEWEYEHENEPDRDRFVIDLAPDWLHKANVSGGGPYCVEVPNRGVDGLLLDEPHRTTFVNHLRIAFRWGGFPGWDPDQARDRWARPPAAPQVINELAAHLLPL